jgi:predicted peptidase
MRLRIINSAQQNRLQERKNGFNSLFLCDTAPGVKITSLICLSLFFGMVLQAQDTSLFRRCDFSREGFHLPYRLLTPQPIAKGKQYPLVIFLHGAGERGDDNAKQLIHGAKIFTKPFYRKHYPCFVLAPQCPEEQKWVDTDWKGDKQIFPETPTVPMKVLIALIDSFIKANNVDTSRIYVTGLSMGGFGTWDLAYRMNTRIAAVVPICGGGDEDKAEMIKSIPAWAFHGDKDPLVKPFRSANMVNAINKAGGKARLTMYRNAGHDSWTRTYDNPEVIKWMFSQKRK